MSDDLAREFVFTDRDFQLVRELIKTRAGIDLGLNKQSLVYGRLAKRLRLLGLWSFADYLTLVHDETSDEAGRFVNAITTNVTDFFREKHHFEYLASTVLPALWKRNQSQGRARFWSAGCSTGEEPYSLAMVVRECMPAAGNWDIKILATDLDTDVLAHAQAGIYSGDRVEKIPRPRLLKHFQPTGRTGGEFRAGEGLRSLLTFKQLNLMGPWPMKGQFDVIFCRNVVIYFDDATKANLLRRYREILDPAGYLFLGHSESLVDTSLGFSGRGKTIYQKNPATRAA